tara:strand:- start:814 stop:948 length:135 start_codon:yes stop_codon:yes gene_type:complete
MSKKQGFIEYNDYRKAYDILMEYFDCIPEDEQQNVHEELEELGL